jgi:hypothetical protein
VSRVAAAGCYDGNTDAAAGLFQGTLLGSPDSPRLRNNLAFCLIPTQPEQSAAILELLRKGGSERGLTAANLATAAVVRGDYEGARRWADELRGLSVSLEQGYYVWDLATEPARVIDVEDIRVHVHDLVARSLRVLPIAELACPLRCRARPCPVSRGGRCRPAPVEGLNPPLLAAIQRCCDVPAPARRSGPRVACAACLLTG